MTNQFLTIPYPFQPLPTPTPLYPSPSPAPHIPVDPNPQSPLSARCAKRRGSSTLEEVLLFLREDGSKLIECSRCYATNWGFYFNNLGVGQRIGMFSAALDKWLLHN